MQTDDIIVEDIPDEERAKQADRDYEEQKDAFFRRNMAGAMGRCAAPAGTAVLAPGEIKKKIEQESLRILAKMLGCTYDTLRQRHREYALHRMMAVLGGVAGVAVVFTIYAFHQSAKINERYQESRRNQAR